jgi:hypothetical protein
MSLHGCETRLRNIVAGSADNDLIGAPRNRETGRKTCTGHDRTQSKPTAMNEFPN